MSEMASASNRGVHNTHFRPECECVEGDFCNLCSTPGGDDVVQTLAAALGKLDGINSKIASLQMSLSEYNNRIKNLENSDSESKRDCIASKSNRKVQKRVSNKGKCRSARVTENAGSNSQLEVSTSEDELGLNNVSRIPSISLDKSVKSSSKSEKFKKRHYEESSSSGDSTDTTSTGTKRRRKRRSKVKSGADVKQRPVIKTEVWPHTIANEDYGVETTSEDISLSSFLACFTHLIITSVEKEAAGRSVLLHAVSTVLECLPWVEARTFHNLTMVKIEQGRLNWNSDFKAMADKFLDRKVRMSLRSRVYSANKTSNSNPSKSRSEGKSSENFGYGHNNFANKRSSANSVICRLWNSGFCSFGENCKRWHVCLSCAEQGKLGEPHQASTHEDSSAWDNTPKPHV